MSISRNSLHFQWVVMIFYATAGNMEGNNIGRKVTQRSSIDSQVKFLKFNGTKTYRMIPNRKLKRTPGWHATDVGPHRANKGRNKEPISSGNWQGRSAMAGTSVRQRYNREFGLPAACPPAKRWYLFGSQYDTARDSNTGKRILSGPLGPRTKNFTNI